MARWLSIVGIGEDGVAGLTPVARALIDGAELLAGGERHLAMAPDGGCERMVWPQPMSDAIPLLEDWRPRPVCVLATGDPTYYGIGVMLARHFPADEITIVPASSAFSLACARLAWPQAETDMITLHGRPVEAINGYLRPGARIVALSHDGGTPGAVAELLKAAFYGNSRFTVLEHMGGPHERVRSASVRDWSADDVTNLNVVAVECIADEGAAAHSRIPGLPDEAFRNDGQLTKREVRAATLAALQPLPEQNLWDVGAGCGSVAIEWMRCHFTCRAAAIERHEARCAMIRDNAASLGTPKLHIVHGAAPGALSGLNPPDAIFIGGGISADGVFETCWRALRPGGRLVANAVTLESEQALFRCAGETGGALSRLQISRAAPLGGLTGWRPMMPVTQLVAVKP
ncbi:MAG: precorrin-6y C5,15-methyltransferase (decarboxylating) subunit CbiE [Alphaproteobacteria bacterium]